MKVKPIGEVITVEKIRDPEGRKLIFDPVRGRVFREGQKGKQINVVDLREILLSHYGIEN